MCEHGRKVTRESKRVPELNIIGVKPGAGDKTYIEKRWAVV